MYKSFENVIKYPSPDTNVSTSPAGGEVTRLLRCARNDIHCLGRSMIEMLGVLAIIGVLSVGGIAGYAKAMEKFKVSKAIGEYSYLINGFLEHIDNLKHNHKSGEEYGLSEFAKSAGLLPQLWQDVTNINSDGMLQDSYGSYVRIYMSPDELLTFDFWIGGLDDNKKSYGFDIQFCQELFNNLAKPLHYAVYDVLMYHMKTENSGGSKWYGSALCNKTNKKCLHSITLSDINTACSSCVKGDEGCAVIVRF